MRTHLGLTIGSITFSFERLADGTCSRGDDYELASLGIEDIVRRLEKQEWTADLHFNQLFTPHADISI